MKSENIPIRYLYYVLGLIVPLGLLALQYGYDLQSALLLFVTKYIFGLRDGSVMISDYTSQMWGLGFILITGTMYYMLVRYFENKRHRPDLRKSYKRQILSLSLGVILLVISFSGFVSFNNQTLIEASIFNGIHKYNMFSLKTVQFDAIISGSSYRSLARVRNRHCGMIFLLTATGIDSGKVYRFSISTTEVGIYPVFDFYRRLQDQTVQKTVSLEVRDGSLSGVCTNDKVNSFKNVLEDAMSIKFD